MKKSILILVSMAFAILGSGCGGGGGNNSPVPELTQVEKANKFVRGLNYYEYERYEHLTDYAGRYIYDSNGYAVYGWVTYYDYSTQYAVAKGVSQQPGFAVVMDTYSNKYYAIAMTDFYKISSPGATNYTNTNAKDYERSMTLNGLAFFNLRYNAGNGTFTQILFGGAEGLTFKARELSSSEINVSKAKAQAFSAKQSLVKGNLMKLGMLENKANVASGLIIAAQSTNGSSELTIEQTSDVLKQVTGLTLQESISAANGSFLDQAKALEKAVEAGAIRSPEQGFELVTKVIGELGLVNP